MVRAIVVIGLSLFLAVIFVYSQQDKDIEGLIQDLGSDNYETRESAYKELKAMGEKALPYLKEATESEDPEIRERASDLIREIESMRTEESQFKRSYELTIDNGKVRLYFKDEDKEYKADSMQEFKEKYPDLYKKYLNNIKIWVETGEEDQDDFSKFFKRFKDEDLDEILRWFRQRFEDRDWEDFMKQFKGEKERLKRFAEKFKKKSTLTLKSVPSKKIGIKLKPLDEEQRANLGLDEDEGIMVEDVKKDSLGEKLGLKKGDIIVSVNGETITSALQTRDLILDSLDKDEVELIIIRDGKKQALKINTSELR